MSIVTSSSKSGGDTVTAVNNNAQRLDIIQMAGDYATSTGSANAYVLALDAAITAVGYTTGAKYKFKANFANTGAATININGKGAKAIKKNVSDALAAGDIPNGMIVELIYDGTNMQLVGSNPPKASQAEAEAGTNDSKYLTPATGQALVNVNKKFRGDGSDGALTISSGSTDVDCGAARVVIKNYTSINITGTGQLTFSNPHAEGTFIIIKCQGACVITSSTSPAIDVSGMGGLKSDVGMGIFEYTNPGGDAGSGATIGDAGAALSTSLIDIEGIKFVKLFVGAGGGNGGDGTHSGNGGDGGRGGGGLLLQVGGDINLTGEISVAGLDGSAGDVGITQNPAGDAGAGGGGGGSLYIFYESATAVSGTLTVSGGAGGAGGHATSPDVADGGAGGAGGDGYSSINVNTEFV